MRQSVTVTIEIEVEVTADAERSDYGVEGSPVWDEAVNLQCENEIIVEGVPIMLDAMPKDVRELVMKMAYEAAHDGDWND